MEFGRADSETVAIFLPGLEWLVILLGSNLPCHPCKQPCGFWLADYTLICSFGL